LTNTFKDVACNAVEFLLRKGEVRKKHTQRRTSLEVLNDDCIVVY
jgi:hypothetical protein